MSLRLVLGNQAISNLPLQNITPMLIPSVTSKEPHTVNGPQECPHHQDMDPLPDSKTRLNTEVRSLLRAKDAVSEFRWLTGTQAIHRYWIWKTVNIIRAFLWNWRLPAIRLQLSKFKPNTTGCVSVPSGMDLRTCICLWSPQTNDLWSHVLSSNFPGLSYLTALCCAGQLPSILGCAKNGRFWDSVCLIRPVWSFLTLILVY